MFQINYKSKRGQARVLQLLLPPPHVSSVRVVVHSQARLSRALSTCILLVKTYAKKKIASALKGGQRRRHHVQRRISSPTIIRKVNPRRKMQGEGRTSEPGAPRGAFHKPSQKTLLLEKSFLPLQTTDSRLHLASNHLPLIHFIIFGQQLRSSFFFFQIIFGHVTDENKHVHQQPYFMLMRIRGCQNEQQLSESRFPSPQGWGEPLHPRLSSQSSKHSDGKQAAFQGLRKPLLYQAKASKDTMCYVLPSHPRGKNPLLVYLLTSVEQVNLAQPVPLGELGLKGLICPLGSPDGYLGLIIYRKLKPCLTLWMN